MPQEGGTPVKPILKRIVQEGGKLGFTTFLVTQRSQDIDKRILGQGALYVLHAVLHPRDKEVYVGIVPEPRDQVERRIAELGQGDAIVVHEQSVKVMRIRPQETYHVGVTPGMGRRAILPTPALDAEMLEQLRAVMTRDLTEDPVRKRLAWLEQRVLELEEAAGQRALAHAEALAAKEDELGAVRAQLDLLGAIRVTLEGASIQMSDLAPSALYLDSLSAQVKAATIDVKQLLAAGSAEGEERTGEAGPLIPAHLLLLRIQQLEEEKAQLLSALEEARRAAGGGSEVANEEGTPPLLFSEEKLLKRLVGLVEALSRSEKALMVWLVEHDGREVDSKQLADAMGMDVRVTWTDSTRRLVKLPFITRRSANKFWYQAQWGAFARKSFTSAQGAQTALRRVLEAAQGDRL